MKRLLFSVAAVCCIAFSLCGRDLPKLPDDANISRGVFPNGISWFVAANPAEKGYADFSLIYRHSADAGDYVGVSRGILSSQGRIQGRNLQKFMSSNAVAPSVDGYVRCTDDAVVFRFENVMLPRAESLQDSLLLAVFGIADELASRSVTTRDSLHFPLENMAVVVAGDVNPAEVAAKMRTFSLMIPKTSVRRFPDETRGGSLSDGTRGGGGLSDKVRGGADPAGGPGAAPKGRPGRNPVKVSADTLGELLRISALAVFPRMPRERMATTQFAVMDKMTETFSSIAERRLADALCEAGIPFADLDAVHISGAGNSGEESVEISFRTLAEYSDAALRCFGATLGSLNAGGIYDSDIILSNRDYEEKCREYASATVSNAEYVKICENSFLYGAPLGSGRQLCAFCQSKALPDTLQLRLMRGFADALLKSPEDSSAFLDGWKEGLTEKDHTIAFADTLLLPDRTEKKAKMKPVKSEPVSGGEVWTWQNGLKVYFKRVEGAKSLQWAMAVNRGYSFAENLVPGEAAFMNDILGLCSVSGIGNGTLRDILTAKGVTASSDVSLYSTVISGSAAPGGLDLLLKALTGMFRERKLDPDAVEAYLSGIPVRKAAEAGGRGARLAAIDSLICARYPYSDIRMYENFTDSTVQKAEALFDRIFSDIGDGFLVFSGDVDPDFLKKKISLYAGNFPVSQTSARPPRIRFSPVSGWSSNFRTGVKESIDILMSVELPVTAENLCTSRLAARLLEDSLKDRLTGTGFHTYAFSDVVLFPQERFNVLISLDRIPDDGFAYGSLDDTGILSVLAKLREGISAAPDVEWPSAVLTALKKNLNNSHKLSEASAAYWVKMLTVRYSTGRDFNTKIEDKMNAVTVGQVRALLEKLESGSRIELVVTKEQK